LLKSCSFSVAFGNALPELGPSFAEFSGKTGIVARFCLAILIGLTFTG
jgi:hypothetical protein